MNIEKTKLALFEEKEKRLEKNGKIMIGILV